MQKFMQFAEGARAMEAAIQRMVVVLDNSGSMRQTDYPPNRWTAAAQAAGAMLDIKAERYPEDQVGIVAFGRSARVLHAMCNVRQSIVSLKFAMSVDWHDGDTNLSAGLDLAEQLLPGTASQRPGPGFLRRLSGLLYDTPSTDQVAPAGPSNVEYAIILLTDGRCSPGVNPKPIARRLRDHGVQVAVIGIGGSPQEVDEPLLKELASKEADGTPRYCFISDQAELVAKFKSLAGHIRRL